MSTPKQTKFNPNVAPYIAVQSVADIAANQYQHIAIDLSDLKYDVVDNKLVLHVPVTQEIAWDQLVTNCQAAGLSDQQVDFVVEKAAAALNKQVVVNLLSNRV